jgi:hypothetical protein
MIFFQFTGLIESVIRRIFRVWRELYVIPGLPKAEKNGTILEEGKQVPASAGSLENVI